MGELGHELLVEVLVLEPLHRHLVRGWVWAGVRVGARVAAAVGVGVRVRVASAPPAARRRP